MWDFSTRRAADAEAASLLIRVRPNPALIIYDQSTGSLYYDRDGTGGAAQIKFADLNNEASLRLSDIIIV